MRLITTHQGVSILHMSPDDTTPQGGVLVQDAISLINNAYKFGASPVIPPGIPFSLIPLVQFQNGEFTLDNKKFPITQLTLMTNGIVVVAQTTDVSDAILNDLISLLDSSLSFRIASSHPKRSHLSSLVVEFGRGIEDYVVAIAHMEEIINAAFSERQPGPFKIKKIVFGREAYNSPEMMLNVGLDAAERADITIERRVGHPFSENRYYCGAPLATSVHLQVLEAIEKALGE